VKALAAFALLLTLGLVALKLAIGDDIAVRGVDANQSPEAERPQPPGVSVQDSSLKTTVSQSGKLVYPRRREIDLGGGEIRKETLFVLRAEDSRPIGNGVQQLSDVRLELFDNDKHAATVTASQAFLEIGRDADGKPRLEENKTIDLRDTVVTSEPGGRLAGMRLQLGDAKVNVSDDEIQLTTADDQLVEVQLEGRREARLTGRGAQTRLPRSRQSSLRTASVTIFSEPRLETEDVQVRASGRMHYVEDMVSGAARITLRDDVALSLDRGSLAAPGGRRPEGVKGSVARGDKFTGWLLRDNGDHPAPTIQHDDRSDIIWQRLALAGAPATVDVPGMQIETPRITVRPGPLGEPYVITAHGGPSRVAQTELGGDNNRRDLLVGQSPRRIHLVRPGNSAGALHRALGFPRWTTQSLEQQQVVVFMDRSRLKSGARDVFASEGIVIARRLDTETSCVQAFGAVEISQKSEPGVGDKAETPALTATGSDGMMLTIAGSEERLRLGPSGEAQDAAWRQHRYDIRYGDAFAKGLGSCNVTRVDGQTDLSLRAPRDEISAYFGREKTELRSVRQLSAKIEGGRVTDLDVIGLPVETTFIRGGERLRAQAPRVTQTGPRSMRLLPVDVDVAPWNKLDADRRTPRLQRNWLNDAGGELADGYSVEVRGPRIDIYHAGPRAVIVDARANDNQPAQIYASLPKPEGRETTTVACAAGRMRLLPFVMTPEASSAHFGDSVALRRLATHSLSRPWLLVDEVRLFELDDEAQGHVEASGQRMLISQGGAAALFLGDPDTQTPAVVRRRQGDREVVVRGARVRLRNDAEIRLSALSTFEGRSVMMPPTMTLHDSSGSGLLSDMRAVCRGDIHIEPDAVRYTGPVEATSLLPDGALDPEGLIIDARQLVMRRLRKTGQVSIIRGDDVRVDWPRLGARAAKVELDLLNETCVASDPKAAIITLPNGRELRSTRIAVNYLTWEVSAGPSSASQSSEVIELGEGRTW